MSGFDLLMEPLYVNHRNALYELDETAALQENKIGNPQKVKNTTLPADCPRGILSGSVASVVGPLTAGACDLTKVPLGVFMRNATPDNFEVSGYPASGKVTVQRGGTVKVFVYETRNAADSADLTYAEGTLLYSSVNGLLTNELTGTQRPVGQVGKAPTTSDPSLIVELFD